MISRRKALAFATTGMALYPFRSARAVDSNTDVLILGAGIAGLHAARLFQQEGFKATVLESSDRVGGRCWTAHHIPGRPELGAQQIGPGYGRVRANASELGVELVEPQTGALAETRQAPQIAVSIGGAVPTTPWAESAQNKLRADERTLPPMALLNRYLMQDQPLVELQDWLKPELAHLDRTSLRQILTAHGASPEALRLIEIGVAAESLDAGNALDFMRKRNHANWEAKIGTYHEFRDGTSALTDAMAASLKNRVQLRRVVTQIQVHAKRVRVRCQDGSIHTARAAISTIPLSVFKDIAVQGAVSPQHRDCWRSTRYNQLVQVFIRPRERFWERDGLPPVMWSDGPLEMILHIPSRTEANGVMLAYVNGQGAERLSSMSETTVRELTLRELTRMRPAAKDAVDVTAVHSWSRYPHNKGHIAYFAPGDIARFAAVMMQPVGALFFAGEHCSRTSTGVEGACESAENAAVQILQTL